MSKHEKEESSQKHRKDSIVSSSHESLAKLRGSSGIKGLVQNPYVFATAIFASIGGVLFGYDQGVISGVQEMPTFIARFPMNDAINGFVVSILELGAWFGALIVGYFADRLGRKYSIVVFSVVFLLGSSIQGGAQNIGYLLGGRFVTGMGVGAMSMLVPLYQSEIAPPEIRGSLVSLQQLAVTFGIFISFWIDYGCNNIDGEAQWRVPLCIQIAFALILGVGILFFPHSPRWLMSVDREQEALQVLSQLRRLSIDHPLVQEEWREIKITVEFDREVERQTYPHLLEQGNRGRMKITALSYLELFKKATRKRLFIGCVIMFFQQFIGVNALIYYAPKIFKSVGLTGDTVSLLATGVVGIINLVLTIPTVLFLDQLGRKPILLVASVGLTISMLIIAVITGLFEDNWEAHRTEGWVAIVFVYIFIANFAYSWGPIAWVIPAEIFPLRTRAKAMSISTSANWMCNFIIGLVVPPMLSNIKFGTYVFFCVFCALSFFFVLFFVPETKGRSLEEMDEIFGGQEAAKDDAIMSRVKEQVARTSIPGVKPETTQTGPTV
ncbi:general substrate transporter [Radiomyces spectabilis]|uniref:general substrate transporter n=1 Tax=Radiomyces spectabilis TaxID=64574 RepID=UPI0022205D11|nr:general substrate transporter [Radiomyces spectabilis]KAI8384477.1 general substrate transporter [Radiomyces spectabilis]